MGFSTWLCTNYAWGEYPPGAGIDFRAFVHLRDDDGMRARGVRYVVLHEDLEAEMARVVDPIGARASGFADVRGCAEAFRRAGWPEVYRDESIRVFAVPEAGRVSLAVHDFLGRRVATLASGRYPAGEFWTTWGGRDEKGRAAASGIFFVRLEGHGFGATEKIVLLR